VQTEQFCLHQFFDDGKQKTALPGCACQKPGSRDSGHGDAILLDGGKTRSRHRLAGYRDPRNPDAGLPFHPGHPPTGGAQGGMPEGNRLSRGSIRADRWNASPSRCCKTATAGICSICCATRRPFGLEQDRRLDHRATESPTRVENFIGIPANRRGTPLAGHPSERASPRARASRSLIRRVSAATSRRWTATRGCPWRSASATHCS